MPKTSWNDYSTTAASNTDINSINIDENCPAANLNNAIREVMKQTADVVAGTTALSSVNIDGGAIDGTVIGGTTPAAINGTTGVFSTSSSGDAVRITQTGSGNALVVEDSANPDSTPFVVNASGKTLVGLTTAQTTAIGSAAVQIAGGTAPLTFLREADSSTAINLEFSKSRASGAILASGDTIGRLYFSGSDGTAKIPAAFIDAAVDGTPGTNDMPGRLVFSTTADGASSPTERMRIDSSGNVGIGVTTVDTALGTKLHVAGTIRTDTGSAGANPAIVFDHDNFADADANFIAVDRTSEAMRFYVNAAERMRIDSSGNVGIGETSVSNPIHVKGGNNTLSTIIVDGTASGGGRKWGLRPGLSGVSNGYFSIYDETAAAARLTITDSGTVDVPGTLTATTFGTSSQNAYGARTVSTSSPTGGSDGDIWYTY